MVAEMRSTQMAQKNCLTTLEGGMYPEVDVYRIYDDDDDQLNPVLFDVGNFKRSFRLTLRGN